MRKATSIIGELENASILSFLPKVNSKYSTTICTRISVLEMTMSSVDSPAISID